MALTVDEVKGYLRVDHDDDDALIEQLIASAVKLCMDVLRTDDEMDVLDSATGVVAALYATAYFYEHREEADHHALVLTLCAMLDADRTVSF